MPPILVIMCCRREKRKQAWLNRDNPDYAHQYNFSSKKRHRVILKDGQLCCVTSSTECDTIYSAEIENKREHGSALSSAINLTVLPSASGNFSVGGSVNMDGDVRGDMSEEYPSSCPCTPVDHVTCIFDRELCCIDVNIFPKHSNNDSRFNQTSSVNTIIEDKLVHQIVVTNINSMEYKLHENISTVDGGSGSIDGGRGQCYVVGPGELYGGDYTIYPPAILNSNSDCDSVVSEGSSQQQVVKKRDDSKLTSLPGNHSRNDDNSASKITEGEHVHSLATLLVLPLLKQTPICSPVSSIVSCGSFLSFCRVQNQVSKKAIFVIPGPAFNLHNPSKRNRALAGFRQSISKLVAKHDEGARNMFMMQTDSEKAATNSSVESATLDADLQSDNSDGSASTKDKSSSEGFRISFLTFDFAYVSKKEK